MKAIPMSNPGRLTLQAWREEQDKLQAIERERIQRETLEQVQSVFASLALVYALRQRRRPTFTQRLGRFLFG